jgi:hypothetical protein
MWREPTPLNKYAPLAKFAPHYVDHVQWTAERYLGVRDGVVVAMALELYRRQHGSYPSSLQALTPALLPQIPADRITGEPLRYRLTDGKPNVYSVGADRDDDGGKAPVGANGMEDSFGAAAWGRYAQKPRDGDWLLYPQPKEIDPQAESSQ